jgi:ferritin-like metal-binding protein YciE
VGRRHHEDGRRATLEEEKAADDKLTQIAESEVNREAA